MPHAAVRLFHLELRQASASHATASNFDEPDRSGICDLPCRSPKGQSRHSGCVPVTSGLPPTPDMALHCAN